MSKLLTVADFKRIDLTPPRFYWSHVTEDEYEVCLEPCLNGFDVAIYDLEHQLVVRHKKCTNVRDMQKIEKLYEAINKGVGIANSLLIQIRPKLSKCCGADMSAGVQCLGCGSDGK